MYDLRQFGWMVRDDVRMRAFDAAIAAAVRPGDVVLDIGTGTGVFALMACARGAEHVYAVDVNALVSEGPANARQNGVEDRITFLHDDVLRIELPQQVDVVLGDVRGQLPGFGPALELYREVVERHLVPGGRVIPERDTVFVGVLSDVERYRREVLQPWTDNALGVDLSAALPAITSTPVPQSLGPHCRLVGWSPWVVLDYRTGERVDEQRVLRFAVDQTESAHFLVLWFDAELQPGVTYSNAPFAAERPFVYNQLLLPLADPLELQAGDDLEVEVRADTLGSDFVFTWTCTHRRGEAVLSRRRQSSFDVLPLPSLRHRVPTHVPRPARHAAPTARVLASIDGVRSVGDLATDLRGSFPELFPDPDAALRFVADLVERYSARPQDPEDRS